MPKDEFDFEDPMELSGVVLGTDASTTDTMCECFIEEYMRMGYSHTQVFDLFNNPHYLGMRMVLDERGESFVREKITAIFAVWGRQVSWTGTPSSKDIPRTQSIEFDASAVDPTGTPIPILKK